MNRMMGFLAGLFCGAVVGSVTALLLAPMSGRELQTQARERFDDLFDEAREAAQAKRAQLEAQLAALKARGTPATETAAPA
jgi:gas vesicle protein